MLLCFSEKILSFFLLLLQKQPFRVPETNPNVFCFLPLFIKLCSHSSSPSAAPATVHTALRSFPASSSSSSPSSASLSPTPRHAEHPQPLVFYHFGEWFAITCSNFPFNILSIPTALLTPLRGEKADRLIFSDQLPVDK